MAVEDAIVSRGSVDVTATSGVGWPSGDATRGTGFALLAAVAAVQLAKPRLATKAITTVANLPTVGEF